MSESFNKHAYRRTIIATLQRVMLDRFIQSDSSTKNMEQMICEEVPRSESVVPQQALIDFFNELQLEENEERQLLGSFQMTDQKRSLFKNTGVTNGKQPAKGKKSKKPKPEAPAST